MSVEGKEVSPVGVGFNNEVLRWGERGGGDLIFVQGGFDFISFGERGGKLHEGQVEGGG